uniref:Receptor ligand binding region domain-containing protein n=1 Tax=Meloidogyne enterolobii TaxID=390850 RepID=A0A6V7U944_MELEN|nr:unnamed protein product [Meloidogyne enterolobii]
MKLLSISPVFLLNYLFVCVYSQLNSTNDTTTIIILPDSTGTTTTTTLLPTLITTKPNTITTTTSVIKANTTLTTSTSTTSTPPSTSTTQPTPTTSTPSNGLNLQLKVGLLFANGSKDLRAQFGFGQSAPAITLAMQRAASEQLINNINFNFTWFMCDCDEALASGYTNQLFVNLHVDAIIGPPCVTSALITGYISSFYNFPVFVWGAAVAAELNDIPTVTNVNTNTNMLAMGVQALLMQFQWQEISTIYIPDNIGMVCSYFQQDMESLLNNNPNITIVYKKQMDSTTASMKETLNKIKTCSRIIVSCFDSAVDRRNFLLAMNDLGLVESTEYVLIIAQLQNQGMLQQISSGVNGVQYDSFWKQSDGSNDGRDADALKAARRSIVIDLENQSVDQINTFNKKMYAQFGQPPFNCNGSCMGGADEQNPSPYARSLHDTTYAYLRALNLTKAQYGYLSTDLARNGTLINNMSNGEFIGETGTVILDSLGNREPTFYVTILDTQDQPQDVIQISILNSILSLTKKYTDESVIWANRGGKRPLYKPLCGYTGTECPQNMTTYILIGVGLILLLFFATISGVGYAIRRVFNFCVKQIP